MTKTTTPKAPRLTKAEKLAKIELETLAIEAQIAAEKFEAQGTSPEAEVAPAEVEELYVPIKKAMKQVKTVKTGVGFEILTLIAQGELSNKEIVEMVLAANPLRKTTYACVAWYKSQVAAGKIDLPVIEATEEEETEDDCATGMEDEALSDDQA